MGTLGGILIFPTLMGIRFFPPFESCRRRSLLCSVGASGFATSSRSAAVPAGWAGASGSGIYACSWCRTFRSCYPKQLTILIYTVIGLEGQSLKINFGYRVIDKFISKFFYELLNHELVNYFFRPATSRTGVNLINQGRKPSFLN